MKTALLIISLSFLIFYDIHSQDIINTKDGKKIECKITNEDSLKIYFTTEVNDREVSTFIFRENVQEIVYENPAVLSQSSSDSIVSEKTGLGYRYYSNGQKLTGFELVEKLKTNDQSWEKYNQAKGISLIANIFAASGGALIGWPIGTAIGGGDPNWVLAGVGAGLAVIGITIATGADKKIKQAVEIYNQGVGVSSMRVKEIRVGMTSGGFGLCVRF